MGGGSTRVLIRVVPTENRERLFLSEVRFTVSTPLYPEYIIRDTPQ